MTTMRFRDVPVSQSHNLLELSEAPVRTLLESPEFNVKYNHVHTLLNIHW